MSAGGTVAHKRDRRRLHQQRVLSVFCALAALPSHQQLGVTPAFPAGGSVRTPSLLVPAALGPSAGPCGVALGQEVAVSA